MAHGASGDCGGGRTKLLVVARGTEARCFSFFFLYAEARASFFFSFLLLLDKLLLLLAMERRCNGCATKLEVIILSFCPSLFCFFSFLSLSLSPLFFVLFSTSSTFLSLFFFLLSSVSPFCLVPSLLLSSHVFIGKQGKRHGWGSHCAAAPRLLEEARLLHFSKTWEATG